MQLTFTKMLLLAVSSGILFQCAKPGDSEKFAREYPLVGGGNIFTYRSASETADILEKGRGIVFIGFKECPWCQQYAVYLHDVAREMAVETIYYCDIKKDRETGSASYQKILSVLANRLQYDDEGRPRVYVPDAAIVSRGRIITHDYETSKETLGYDTPQEYWNEQRVNALKERLRAGIGVLQQIIANSCNTCL